MTEHILTHYGRKYNKKEKEWIKTRSEHQDTIKADTVTVCSNIHSTTLSGSNLEN